ncbi:N-6 DNA methylase [Nonomuraea sediminis]|uniref:N-6 DNA methylase n=1 Tax=Nonomuraea sediminis TaxID=2835864 RepID=UPI001BDC482D|nr:N-6 DNA methylase [Nonomuraea sediminis]
MTDHVMVAASDIARLVGVGRAAVSNWRRRFPDFPEPIGGTAASPLFSLAEVEAWLRAKGKLKALPEDEAVWQRVRNAADDLVLPDVVAALLTDISGSTAPSDDLVEAAATLAERRGRVETVEFFFARLLEAHSRRIQVLAPHVANLMVDLIDDQPTIYDPCCGFGSLLLAAANRAERLVGQEREESTSRIAAARLRVRGADAEIVAGDALTRDAHPALQADAALCVPPFNERSWGFEELANDPRWVFGLPPRGEPEMAWVQHCLARVRPGGTVVVMMPAVAASRRSGRRIRAQLLRTGALRAVMALPSGAAPHSNLAPHLWILRRPNGSTPSHVLVMDASQDLSGIGPAWRGFQSGEALDSDDRRRVSVIDLLDDEVDVTPARHLVQVIAPLEEIAPTIEALRARVRALLRRVPRMIAEERPLAMSTLGELSRAGSLVIEHTPMRVAPAEREAVILTAKDVVLGRPPSGRGEPLATADIGDIVLPLVIEQPAARVMTEKVALGPHLIVIRPNRDLFDPHFIAGFLRVTSERTAGSRVDARRAAIPLLPVEEQRRYARAFRKMEEYELLLRDVQETGERLSSLVWAGLVNGQLRPG